MDHSLLDNESSKAEGLLEKLLLESGMDTSQSLMGIVDKDTGPEKRTADGVPYVILTPHPGFCVKLKNKSGEKVFINICHSDMVPPTREITDSELLKILESDDLTQFRIPMCIGEPRAEVDKSGGGCTAIDVIVHTDFVKKLQTNELFQTFFLTVSCEGIEEKHKLELRRDWLILKNRRCIGKLREQSVRTKSKPLIVDMADSSFAPLGGSVSAPHHPGLIQEMDQPATEIDKKMAPEPKFSIMKEPAEGHPEFLVAEIHLPQVKTAQTLMLDVGEDRIVLETRSNIYHLDIYIPYNIVQEEVGAQFDKCTKILTLTMPVQPLGNES